MSVYFSVYCTDDEVEGPSMRVGHTGAKFADGEPSKAWQAFLEAHEFCRLVLLRAG